MTTEDDASRVRECLNVLGWSGGALGEYLQCGERLGRAWASGRRVIPAHVLRWLELSAAYLAAHPYPEGWRVDRKPEGEGEG